MDQIELSVKDAVGLWPGTLVYRIACGHGVSSAAVLPGRRPLDDLVVLDLVMVGHRRRNGCACGLIVEDTRAASGMASA